jgi:hypothetical protein
MTTSVHRDSHWKQSKCLRPARVSFNGKPKASALVGDADAFGLPLNNRKVSVGENARSAIVGTRDGKLHFQVPRLRLQGGG